jgi:phage baseplate assembly protein W
MAYRISNIDPINLQSKTAVGISLPFNGPTGFNSTYTTTEQIKSNLINYLLTRKGERLFRPTFGANLRNFIFEQISNNNINDLQDILTSKIESNFSKIKIKQLVITPDTDNNIINIFFSYNIINTSIKDNISINIG